MKLVKQTLSFSFSDGIGFIELTQPPANQMTTEFFSEFNDLVDDLRTTKDLMAIVISSKGRHFSSGTNIEELLDYWNKNDSKSLNAIENWNSLSEKNYRSFLFFEQSNIPVVAAIRGVCIGSAFELALYSHFRFCGEDAVFGLPETTFNLMPGLGGIRKLLPLCGEARTIELALKGNTFGADRAVCYNLVDKIVPRRQVFEFATIFARKVMLNYKKQKKTLYLQQIQPVQQLD